MENAGAIYECEWNSFNGGMCSEEADFMAQLFGNSSFPNIWSNVNNAGAKESSMQSSDTSMYSYSQGSSYESGNSNFPFPSLSHYTSVPHQIIFSNGNLMTMDYYMTENKNDNVMEGDNFLNQDLSSDSLESNEIIPQEFFSGANIRLEEIERPMVETVKEERANCPSEVSRKRPRIPVGDVGRSKKNMKFKKCRKVDDNEEDKSKHNVVVNRQSTSSACSEEEEDDSIINASLELIGGSSSSKSGKTRASRGSATDPQSLYARKRRERINERLKILQNLVPNGTKVDISTMLEEAVQYVKFLQLQIKLLSSDDHWMYAPLAYNGMDIGLDHLIQNIKT